MTSVIIHLPKAAIAIPHFHNTKTQRIFLSCLYQPGGGIVGHPQILRPSVARAASSSTQLTTSLPSGLPWRAIHPSLCRHPKPRHGGQHSCATLRCQLPYGSSSWRCPLCTVMVLAGTNVDTQTVKLKSRGLKERLPRWKGPWLWVLNMAPMWE